MKRFLAVLVVSLLVLIVTAACSGSSAAPEVATATPAPTGVAAVPAAPTLAAQTPSAAAAATVQSSPTSLPTTVAVSTAVSSVEPAGSVSVGLATPQPTIQSAQGELPALKAGVLKSYTAHIDVIESGTAATATPSASSIDFKYSADPAPGSYSMTANGSPAGSSGPPGDQFSVIVIGANMYAFSADVGKWIQYPSTSGTSLPLGQNLVDPDAIAKEVPAGTFSEANVVNRHESIDGVDTTHYRAGEAQIQQLLKDSAQEGQTPVDGQADFWVANSGYLKKYQLAATMRDEKGDETSQNISMLVSNENQPVQIEAPPPDQIISLDQLMGAMLTPSPEATTAP